MSIIPTEQNTPEKNLAHEQNNEIEKKRKDLKAELIPFLSPEKSWEISVGITNLLTNSNPDNKDVIEKNELIDKLLKDKLSFENVTGRLSENEISACKYLKALMEYIKFCRTNKIIDLEMFNVGLFGDNNNIFFGKYLGEILYKTNKTINDFVDSVKANDFCDSAIAKIFKALNNYKTFLLISLIEVERSKKISEDPEYKTKINELKKKFLDEEKKKIRELMEERPTDFWLDYIKIEYADAKDSPKNNITKKREYETNNPGFRLEAPPEVNVSEWLLEAFCEFWAILTVCAEEALRKYLNESEDNESVSIVVDQIIENFKEDTALNRPAYIVFLQYCVEYYVGNDAQKLIGDDQFKESIKVAGDMGLVEHFTGRLESKCPIQGLISKHSDLFAKILHKYSCRKTNHKFL